MTRNVCRLGRARSAGVGGWVGGWVERGLAYRGHSSLVETEKEEGEGEGED